MREADAPDLPMKPEATQYAALAFEPRGSRTRYLLVTSRRTGRWIFPKGAPEPGERGWETAAREAREEAGVVGTGLEEEVGRFRDLKIREAWTQPLRITLYPVRIESLLDHWEEAGDRRRILASIGEAACLLSAPRMVDLCLRFHDRLLAGGSG